VLVSKAHGRLYQSTLGSKVIKKKKKKKRYLGEELLRRIGLDFGAQRLRNKTIHPRSDAEQSQESMSQISGAIHAKSGDFWTWST